MNESKKSVPVEVDSLADYTPYKLHSLLTTPIMFSTTTFEKPVPMENDQKSNSSSDRPRASSQKRGFMRYFLPINRSRSSSIQNEPPKSSQDQSNNICDMRFFIIRHGERVDRYFGPNWYKIAFDQNEQYRPYHRNFPSTLPLRSNNALWALDTPLTLLGMNSAEKLGQKLKSKNFRPHYIYSSPAMRCILTTIHILKGLQLERPIPIRIEPGLLEYGAARFGMNIFFQPFDWHKYGINVDLSYQPIITHIPPLEREDAYYLRSKHVIRDIEKRHQHSSNESLNIFIVAHATSPETLTWDLIGKKPNINDLYRLSLNIAYLQTVITERQPENKFWSLKPTRSI